jgi:1,4-dihydroxy-6-naphthoate synthase
MIRLTIGHSPDPDDAFMFYAMTHGKIPTGEYEFVDQLEGIESLNERALRAELPVSALSLHQYPFVADRYAVMPVGASMGDGYGPVVVGGSSEWRPFFSVAIPGARTTAALLFKLRFGDAVRVAVEPFDRIPDLVLEGKYDAGVLIHEGQLTYAEQGLSLIEDLGAWWQKETGLPTPLGINVIRRDVPGPEEVTDILRQSIAWGRENPDEAVGYAMRYGRGLDRKRSEKFIGMYVNDFTLDLGDRGRAAVRELLRRAEKLGYVPKVDLTGV